MRADRFQSVMRAALLCALPGAMLACQQNRTFVLVRVEAGAGTPTGVTQLDLQLDLAGKTAMRTLTEKNHGAIALPTTASEEVTSGAHGSVLVTVTARRADGSVLDTGNADGTVATGKVVTVVVRLGTFAGTPDGGVDGAQPVDLAIGGDLATGPPSCQQASDCDDGNACTDDTCDPVAGCQHAAKMCDDANVCTTDSCDPTSGCVHAAVSCDDKNACTTDTCQPATGCAHATQPASACDDNNVCTVDSCDPAKGCVHTDQSSICNDNNPCTTDTCNPISGCAHAPTGPGLVKTPDHTTVFNSIEHTFNFPNNLSNSIWHKASNKIVAGYYMANGYWSFVPGGPYGSVPDYDTLTEYGRMVQIPATNTVIRTNSGLAAPAYNQIFVGAINVTTGAIGSFAVAVFGDMNTSPCYLISSSNTEFLCFTGTAVRHYATTAGSSALALNKAVTLSPAVASGAQCSGACYGGSFAFDGAYYYFAAAPTSSSNLAYLVYDTTGAFVATDTATGNGSIDSMYFDWSVGRYATHDGFGGRTGGTVYFWTGGSSADDTQTYSPVSQSHCVP